MINYYSKFIYSFLSIFILLIPGQAFSQRKYIWEAATIEQATQMSTVEYWEKDIQDNTDKDGVYEFSTLHYPSMGSGLEESIRRSLINRNEKYDQAEKEAKSKVHFLKRARFDAFIEAVKKNPSYLKHLKIKIVALSDDDYELYFMKKLLEVLSNNKHLTALSIIPSSAIVPDCINLIKTNRKLEYLCMVCKFVEDEEMAEIANNLKHNKTLKTFELKFDGDGRLLDTDETYHALKAAERKWWNPLKIVMPRPRRG